MKTRHPYVIIIQLLFFFFLLTDFNKVFAQGTVQAVPTFQSVGLYWSGSGGNANTVCNVKYRAIGAATWLDGYPLWFDTRVHNANDVSPYTGVTLPANQYRGSIVGLNPGTAYEIQLTAGATSVTTNVTTWAEVSTWPIASTTTVSNSSAQLNITTSGTASGYLLYTGNATIDVANAAPNCIYINAAYIIVRGLTLIGASEDAIRLGPQAHDVVIEKCDISGWGATTFPSPYTSFPNTHSGVRVRGKAENDATSTENCYGVTRIVVQRNTIHDPRGTAGSWDDGYPYGPEGVCLQEAGGNNVIRYNDVYGSDTHHFQDGIGGLNNFTKSGFPRENSDIYGNKVSYCWDDGIEVEGADCNVRVYGNFLDNTFTGVSSATNSVGPLYIFRNVTYVSRRHGATATNSSLDVEDRGPFNKCGSQPANVRGGRTYLFHNTILQPTQTGFSNPRGLNGGIIDNGGGPILNTVSRNNIWTAAYQGQGGRSIAEYFSGSGVGCTYQYDVCNTSLVLLAGVASNIVNGNPTYSAGVPVAPIAVNGGPRAQGYELSSNSLGYDAGTVLANFNDGYTGVAPDAGAYETGRPLLQFGVNAYLPANNNLPPTANAGSDQSITLPITSTTLLGSGTDADGTIVSYGWTRLSGPSAVTIAAPNASTTGVSGLTVVGVYVFKLTVTDNLGATGTDTVRVTVNAAANQPPTANAGSDQSITLPTTSTTLAGSGSDADGTIASYGWTRLSGPTAVSFAAPSASSTGVSGLTVVGVYVFKLTVTDNLGATGSDTVRVTVNAAANIPPTANAGSDQSITLPTSAATLVGSGSDADGTIASYGWTRLSGPTAVSFAAPSASTTGVSGLTVVGVYVFKLTVTDNLGATGTDTVRVTVNAAANIPPTANAGNNITITLPTSSTTLVGSGSDADGTIASYGWTRVSGPTAVTFGSASASSTGVSGLTVVGVYVFQLLVTDNQGATGIDTMRVTVNAAANQAPTANAGNNITITLPTDSVTVVGSGSDADGTITGYGWSWQSGGGTYQVVSPGSATTRIRNLQQGVYVFRLTVTDNNGATGFDDITITVNASAPSNQPPIAIAGNNVTLNLPSNSTVVDATASFDPDGTISSYAWSKVSGGAFSSTSLSASTVTLSNLQAGTYVFQLTVTDNSGATDDDNVTIIVSNTANIPPVANAGNNITITQPVSSTNLDGGSSSDPDGILTTYAWTKVSGPGCTIVNASAAATGITGLTTVGTYTFRLTVTDNDGATSTDDVTVTVVAAANQPPVANAGTDITITLPVNSTLLAGSGYDPDGTIATYGWSWVSGPGGATGYSINNANAASTGLNNLQQGVYVFKLTVTDNSGATASDMVTVTVNGATIPANQPPTANAGSDITLTLPVNSTMLTGSGYDPDGTIASYAWSWVSGQTIYTINSAGSAVTGLNGLVQGTYVFKLTVTDNKGATASDLVTVTVNASTNQAPSANAGADITITLPTNTTTLYGSGADGDGTISTYAWSWVSGPGGATGYTIANTGAATTGLYNLQQGVYVFKLTVTDNRGATATDNIMVTVNPPVQGANQPPVARTENDITITLPVNTTQLHGNTSSDPDGVIVAYQWTQISGPAPATLTAGTTSVATASNLTTGIYTFELKVTDDKGATSTKTMKVTVENPQSPKAVIKIYPNPVTTTLNIQYVSNANGQLRLSIYDADRRLMRDEVINKTQVSITRTIDVSLYGRGNYVVEIKSMDGKVKATAQFVKM